MSKPGATRLTYLQEMAQQGYRSESIGPFHECMVPWLLSSREVPKDGIILDIGAGQGHCLIPLHHNGWTNLIAVDNDNYKFSWFEQNYGISSVMCDIGSQPLNVASGSVAAVLCFHLIEHLFDPTNLLSEAFRVLRAGGLVFLVTPDWRKQYKTFWRDPTHLRPFDKESIARLLRMHGFRPEVYSWGSAFGLGRLQAYRALRQLGMIGKDLLAIGEKG